MIEGGRPSALLADLDREREAFLTALDAFARDGHGGTVLAGWDARDLVFHVAAWAEHGADAVAMAEDGRGSSFAYDKAQTEVIRYDGPDHYAEHAAHLRAAVPAP